MGARRASAQHIPRQKPSMHRSWQSPLTWIVIRNLLHATKMRQSILPHTLGCLQNLVDDDLARSSLFAFVAVFVCDGDVLRDRGNVDPADPSQTRDLKNRQQRCRYVITGIAPVADNNFRRLISFYCVWNSASNLATPVFAAYTRSILISLA